MFACGVFVSVFAVALSSVACMKCSELASKYGLAKLRMPHSLREAQNVFTASEIAAAWQIYLLTSVFLRFGRTGSADFTKWADNVWSKLMQQTGSPAYKIVALAEAFCLSYVQPWLSENSSDPEQILADMSSFAAMMAEIAKYPYYMKALHTS